MQTVSPRLKADSAMTDRAALTTDADAFSPVESSELAALASLQERVGRLEDAVAQLRDTRQLEERILDQLAERVNHRQALAPREPTNVIIDAARHYLPAVPALEDQGRKQDAQAATPSTHRRPWFLFDLLGEARTVWRMYFDPRYRLSWPAVVVPVVAVVFMLGSWFWLGSILVVGPVLDRVFILALAYIVYKVLSREAQRYRQLIDRGPPTFRS